MDRQKIILIFAGAWLSAAVLTWFVFSRATGARTEKMVEVYAAVNDLPAGTRVRKSDLKKIRIPERDAPRYAVLNEGQIVDRVLLLPVSAGETLVAGKASSATGAEGIATAIQPGLRAISVPVNDTTSAGGLIQPRSHVDVLFTRTGTMREAITATIAQNVPVMSIGRITEVNTVGPDGKPVATPVSSSSTQTRAAVLLVTPEQAAKIELAKNQGKVSLVLRNPLDRNPAETRAATAESLDPDIFAGTERALRAGAKAASAHPPVNVRDEKQWAELTGGGAADPAKKKADTPKPKFVVDVYHGDKHVQELFQ